MRLVKWPRTSEKLRSESENLIRTDQTLVKVPTVYHLREIGKQLADDFHSVFVLDCCGTVRFEVARNKKSVSDMWSVIVAPLVAWRYSNVSVRWLENLDRYPASRTSTQSRFYNQRCPSGRNSISWLTGRSAFLPRFKSQNQNMSSKFYWKLNPTLFVVTCMANTS